MILSKKLKKKLELLEPIPVLPLSALGFYLVTIFLWKYEIIPEPREILNFLEGLYNNYGYLGLAIATALERIAYLGLYFQGSLIIALAVFFSDGGFSSLITISFVVALTLTVTAIINFFLGRYIASKNFPEKEEILKESEMFSRGLFVSMLHPNLLAFYFFNEGLENGNLKKLIYVPLFMTLYGYVFGRLLYEFAEPARAGLEEPTFLLVFIFLWILVTFFLEHRKLRNKKVKTSI